ncbi:MAG: ABC transporter permease, partial [Desulfocucumaceae bacterium]
MTELAQVEIQRSSFKLSFRMKIVVYRLLAFLGFLILWSAFARFAQSSYIPTPLGVAAAVANLIVNGDYEGYTMAEHAVASSIRVLAGFALAFVMGVTLGTLMGLYPAVYRAIKVVIEPIRFIPPIAWIPVAIVL